ncbi:MAG: hypothetical protein HY513_02830 [Candidatus Aenigmarchaeota archaeon]|nr:hypothetical protein [Candidatus Aenigmarchaeota archaeon]
MILKNPRVLVWILFILIALVAISPNLNPKGVKVVFVEKDSASGLVLGETIYKINDQDATIPLASGQYTDLVKLETNKGSKFIRVNGTLGVTVEKVEPTNIHLGIDLKGGVRAVVSAEQDDAATIEQIVSTLSTRINVFGLREAVIRTITSGQDRFIEISIAGGNEGELRDLLETQGVFEAKIPFALNAAGGKATLKLGKDYEVFVSNASITVENNIYKPGEKFNLESIGFEYNNLSNTQKLALTATVFTGSDVKTVFFDPQRSRIEFADSAYRWFFSVQLSQEGADKFAKVTKNTAAVPGGYLDAPIVFYLDKDLIDSLSISSSLKGRAETEIQISGSAPTQQTAVDEKTKLQSILRSGALPVEIKIVQLDSISPTLGSSFMSSAALAALGALIGVAIIVFARYRRPKLVAPILVVVVSEILITLGLSVVIGWTIDLAAIGGVIAAVGTGINDQIIILDQALKGEVEQLSIRERMKRAFFIVFGAAGTLIVAMLPLTFVGFGALRGFALITIIGILIGIFITRPAYGKIVESLMK